MTVAATLTSSQYTGTGTGAQFSFPNKIFSASDLVITIYDTSGNAYPFVNFANATLGWTYSVLNVDVDTGCIVVLSQVLTSGWVIDIRSVIPELQSTSIKNQGQFLPELHEEAFDRAARMIQDLFRRTYTFGIHGPDTEFGSWPALPGAPARKGYALMFDAATGLPTLGFLSAQNVTQGLIAPLLFPQSTAEAAALVTPTNYAYPPGHAWRYGAVGDGVTDDTAALTRMASINFPCYIPYTSGNGYLISSTVTFTNNHILCDGQIYAVGIVSNTGQASGSWTATNPAVIITGNVNLCRGLFVKGDNNAKSNNTIGMRIDCNSTVFDQCGATNCGFGAVVRSFILQFTDCSFVNNLTNMTMYGASVPTEINSIIVKGGNYGNGTNFAINIGDTRFVTSIGGGNPQGASIRLEGFNCDQAPISIDNMVSVTATNIYFEYTALGTAGFILGGSGAGNLKVVRIEQCFFNNMKYAIQCKNPVGALRVGPNFYTGVTISALFMADMTQGCNYQAGSSSGSFATGQQVRVAFPGQSIGTVDFGGCTIETDGLYNGVQYSIDTITKWYPGAAKLNGGNRTINISSQNGVFYTTPVTSKGGTLGPGGQLTMTTKSDSYLFNGGDRLSGTGAAAAVAVCLQVDYDNGIVFLDTTGSGAATISQVTVTTAAAA